MDADSPNTWLEISNPAGEINSCLSISHKYVFLRTPGISGRLRVHTLRSQRILQPKRLEASSYSQVARDLGLPTITLSYSIFTLRTSYRDSGSLYVSAPCLFTFRTLKIKM